MPFADSDTAASQGPGPAAATVQVHALSAGHFSLPENQFVHPSSDSARTTVPSLCFLIQHTHTSTGDTTRIVFDLGLRRDVGRYSEPIRRHVTTRQPMTTHPDVVKSLKAGGLTPDDIGYIIYSHVGSISRPRHLSPSVVLMTSVQGPLGSCWRAAGLPSEHFRSRSRISGRPCRHIDHSTRRPFIL